MPVDLKVKEVSPLTPLFPLYRDPIEPEVIEWLRSRGYAIRKAKSPAHAPGSATSAAAAASVVPHLGQLQSMVFGYLHARGPIGATDDEVEQVLGLSHQTASASRRELVTKGLAEDSGGTRPTRSGRQATVWIVPPKVTLAMARTAIRAG